MLIVNHLDDLINYQVRHLEGETKPTNSNSMWTKKLFKSSFLLKLETPIININASKALVTNRLFQKVLSR